MGLHRCTTAECPFVGERTARDCNCHKSDEQVLREAAAAMLAALDNLVEVATAQPELYSQLEDALGQAQGAIAAARAAGIEPKE